jgi:hypothetical protein
VGVLTMCEIKGGVGGLVWLCVEGRMSGESLEVGQW